LRKLFFYLNAGFMPVLAREWFRETLHFALSLRQISVKTGEISYYKAFTALPHQNDANRASH